MRSWVRPNLRYLALRAVGAGLATGLGLWLASPACRAVAGDWVAWPGWVVATMAGAWLLETCLQAPTPRIGYCKRDLLFFVAGAGGAHRVPVEHVEAFLLGQGPSWLPSQTLAAAQTVTLVVRIADRAQEFHRRATEPSLASWCDGYITIRGTYCEPLTPQLIQRLNQRLAEIGSAIGRESFAA